MGRTSDCDSSNNPSVGRMSRHNKNTKHIRKLGIHSSVNNLLLGEHL
jgi:hypothetical protein